MNLNRMFFVAALSIFALGILSPVVAVRAQESQLFEGTIAYVAMDGNIVIAAGDGRQVQITSDANLDQMSEYETTYDYLSFSPNGTYLAYYRDASSDAESGIFVYDISGGSIVGRFSEDIGLPVQWHKDSDSFYVKKKEDINIGSGTIINKIYRQYLSGEIVQLGEYYEDDAGYTINYDLETVFYTPEANTPTGILYNWTENTSYQITLDDFDVSGFWSRDGLTYVCTGDNTEYSVIDLQTGEITKTIEALPPLEHIFPNGDVYRLRSVATDLSPDATRLLLNDDLNLYDLNLNTSNYEILYTSSHDDPDYRLYGTWSSSGRLVMFAEFSVYSSYYDDTLGDQGVYVLDGGAPPVLVANDAEFLFWLSKDSERFLYKQYTKAGQQTLVDLMVFDYTNRTNVKIGRLPTINDPGYDPFRFNFDVAWTNNTPGIQGIAPSVEPSPSNEQAPPQPLNTPLAPPSVPSFPLLDINATYLPVCGMCMLLLILLVVLAVFLARSRRRKGREQEQRTQSIKLRSPNEEQVGVAVELAKAKKYQEAFDILQKIVRAEPGNASAWFNLGRVFASVGNFDGAGRCFREAEKLGHPKAVDALDWLRKQKTQ